MKEAIAKYLRKFKKLRVDRAHGTAPHKPILLLTVIQSIQTGLSSNGKIFITPELVALFKSNWSDLVNTQHNSQISLPFYHMKSEGFWKLIPKEGFSDLNKMASLPKSFSNLNAAIEFAEIDNELAEVINDHDAANMLIELILDEYFPETKHNYSGGSSGAFDILENTKNKLFTEPSVSYRLEIQNLINQKNDEEVFIRGGVFKREIPKIYNNSCCVSGMKIDTIHNISMIDAYHIIPFSESYDDTVSNGIALCPNLHRAFDRGLITITPDFEILISDEFVEEGIYTINQFAGCKVNLPQDKKYWPSRENLDWHKAKVFRY